MHTPRFEPAGIPDRTPLANRAAGELLLVRSVARPGELLLAAVLTVSGERLELAPLSTEVAMAAQWDILLPAQSGPLGYAAIAEVWNRGEIAATELAESLGLLPAPLAADLLALASAHRGGGEGVGIEVGPPIHSERDPRNRFQFEERRRAGAYWSAPPEGIGPRLLSWLEASGNDPSDLARDAGWREADLLLLLGEPVDPISCGFAPGAFAELLGQTDIEAEEAATLILAAIPASEPALGSTVLPAEHAVMRRAPRAVESRLRRQSREDYVAEIVAILEERRA